VVLSPYGPQKVDAQDQHDNRNFAIVFLVNFQAIALWQQGSKPKSNAVECFATAHLCDATV
jgi:hypothetical protein